MEFFHKVDELRASAKAVLDEVKIYITDGPLKVGYDDIIKKCGRMEKAIDALSPPRKVKAQIIGESIIFADTTGAMVAETPADPFPETTRELIDRIQARYNVTVENFDRDLNRIML